MRGRQIPLGQILAKLVQLLQQGVLDSAGRFHTIMKVEVPRWTLEVLLDSGVILLRRRQVAGREVGGELLKGLRDRVRSGGGGNGRRLREGLLQGREVRLCGREIAGRKILS